MPRLFSARLLSVGRAILPALGLVVCACGPASPGPASPDEGGPGDEQKWSDRGFEGSPFVTRVLSFDPGDHSGYGQDRLPEVVLGPPTGRGPNAGSLDVLSLGNEGVIVLAFEVDIIDGPGPDLIVFENAFPGWVETAFVAVSEDGESWHEWPCDPTDAEGGYPGCAGVTPTLSHPDNGIDPTDPETAGGDLFDLADIGLARARYVRLRDTGENKYAGSSGGFDLDAVAIVNGEDRDGE